MPIPKLPKTGSVPDTPSTGGTPGGLTRIGDETPTPVPNRPDADDSNTSSGNNNGKGDDMELPDPSDLINNDDDNDSDPSSSSNSSGSSSQPTRIGSGPSTTAYSSTTTAVVTQNASNAALPTWAIVLIIVGGIMVLVFLVSLWVFCARERRRARSSRKKPSYRRALGRALAAATGAFAPLWAARTYQRWRAERRRGSRSADEEYARIEACLKHEDPHPYSQSSFFSSDVVVGVERVGAEDAHTTPPMAMAATPQRNPSLVSSLSSRSDARYERLSQPSPVSDRTPSLRPLPEIRVEGRRVSVESERGGSVEMRREREASREDSG
ncbi:hypothetical protein F4810DRAFT_225203 [Camillea tinctor]|nr:hypothetical protein F4810DRAFT_225203 [Camillea tinctor]